jgi:hypothetical protein
MRGYSLGQRNGNMSYQDLVKVRNNHHMQDILESKALLLELGCTEPTLQLCFKIIESTCLSQGVTCLVNGAPCLSRFQKHVDMHYISFLKESLRAMLTYGFVPWRLRRLQSGDTIPEVLPAGTFEWNTELGPNEEEKTSQAQSWTSGWTERRRSGPRGDDDDSRLIVYRVTPTAGSLKREDVHVYIYASPAYNVSANSIMSATVASPLAHVLTDYKNLRSAQLRRSYADSWNTTAHIISTFKPNALNQEDPTSGYMDFCHESQYEMPYMAQNPFPQLGACNWFERDALMRKQLERPTTHRPMVYTLPRDHDLAQQVMLAPCEDIPFLLEKFRRDISAATGVPYEMIAGKQSGQETTAKTMTSGRLFSANMFEFCRHCQNLLVRVYSTIYRVSPETVEFVLTPMPRMEVESVADLKVLFDIGALTPDMSIELSRVLLGTTARPREAGEKRKRPEAGGDLLLAAGEERGGDKGRDKKSGDKEGGKFERGDDKKGGSKDSEK